MTKKVISVITTCTHNYFKYNISYTEDLIYCSFITLYYLFKSLHKLSSTWEISIFPMNGISHKWITPLSIKAKKSEGEDKTVKDTQFVYCKFYYDYCQMAIRRLNLHSIFWFFNAPEDKRLWIGLLSWHMLIDMR